MNCMGWPALNSVWSMGTRCVLFLLGCGWRRVMDTLNNAPFSPLRLVHGTEGWDFPTLQLGWELRPRSHPVRRFKDPEKHPWNWNMCGSMGWLNGCFKRVSTYTGHGCPAKRKRPRSPGTVVCYVAAFRSPDRLEMEGSSASASFQKDGPPPGFCWAIGVSNIAPERWGVSMDYPLEGPGIEPPKHGPHDMIDPPISMILSQNGLPNLKTH